MNARFRVCSNRASRAKNKASKAFLNFIKRSSEFHALNEDPQARQPFYIKPANERAFPRRANAVGVCIHQIHSFYGLETDSSKNIYELSKR